MNLLKSPACTLAVSMLQHTSRGVGASGVDASYSRTAAPLRQLATMSSKVRQHDSLHSRSPSFCRLGPFTGMCSSMAVNMRRVTCASAPQSSSSSRPISSSSITTTPQSGPVSSTLLSSVPQSLILPSNTLHLPTARRLSSSSGQPLERRFSSQVRTSPWPAPSETAERPTDSAEELAEEIAEGDPAVDDAAQRRKRVQEALKKGSLGFGFSAGGFLYPYYLGILWELRELGILQKGVRVPMAGASAGSLAIATYNSGLEVDSATKALFAFSADCRSKGTRFRISDLLQAFLHEYLPDDAHILNKGVSFVALTRAFPIVRGELVSEWKDKDDFVQSLCTSCHIPLYANGAFVRKFRGKYYMDGGVRNFLPAPPGTTADVKITCFPVSDVLGKVSGSLKGFKRVTDLLDVSIAPDAFFPFQYNYQQMLQFALVPAEDEILAGFIQRGRKDANAWADRCGLIVDGKFDRSFQYEAPGHQADPEAVKEEAKEAPNMG